jgi:uncharacterized membrane protein YraQ (UPF0718 family)
MLRRDARVSEGGRLASPPATTTLRPEVPPPPPRWRALVVPGLLVAGFLAAYALPFDRLPAHGSIGTSAREALVLLHDYARSHVLLCLVPALFIAGAIGVLFSQQTVLRWLGPRAPRPVAYGVASVAGTVLAACSCTVLPLFAGIRKRGAGLGPAITFLYAGPAINLLAVILTFDVLGWRLGVARAVGAVFLSVVVGLAMHLAFPDRDRATDAARAAPGAADHGGRSSWQDAAILGSMIAVLVFANWRSIADEGIAAAIRAVHWPLAAVFLAAALLAVRAWTTRDEVREWLAATWELTRKMLPLLAAGILAAGFLLGRSGHPGVIPERWITTAVGGEGLGANAFASVVGAAMYLATLTEVPILEGLLANGMGRGPALALLLAGPALSLPNVLVVRSVIGTRRTLVYVTLVVLLSAGAGWTYGAATLAGVLS